MVRAHDDVEVAGLAAGQQLVAPVPAHVGEAPQLLVLASHQEHARSAHRLGALVTHLGDVLAARHARPPAAPEMPLLPVEHRLLDVGGPRQEPALLRTVGGRPRGPRPGAVRGLGAGPCPEDRARSAAVLRRQPAAAKRAE